MTHDNLECSQAVKTIGKATKRLFPFIPNSANEISLVSFEGPLFHRDVVFIYSKGVL